MRRQIFGEWFVPLRKDSWKSLHRRFRHLIDLITGWKEGITMHMPRVTQMSL